MMAEARYIASVVLGGGAQVHFIRHWNIYVRVLHTGTFVLCC